MRISTLIVFIAAMACVSQAFLMKKLKEKKEEKKAKKLSIQPVIMPLILDHHAPVYIQPPAQRPVVVAPPPIYVAPPPAPVYINRPVVHQPVVSAPIVAQPIVANAHAVPAFGPHLPPVPLPRPAPLVVPHGHPLVGR